VNFRIDPRRIVNRSIASRVETPAARASWSTSNGDSVMTLSWQQSPHALQRYEN
jgi:hypothetical protein